MNAVKNHKNVSKQQTPQGELKRKIQQQFISNRWSQPSNIFPILDEAAQDFPDPEKCMPKNWRQIDSTTLSCKEKFKIVIDLLDQQADWFIKWFGLGAQP